MKYKKIGIITGSIAICLIATVALIFATDGINENKVPDCVVEHNDLQLDEKDTKNDEVQLNVLEIENNDIKSISIYFSSRNQKNIDPINIEDNRIIHDILEMIQESSEITDESQIGHMSGVARENNKLILEDREGKKEEIIFSYDYLYEIGFIEIHDKQYKPDYSFFRYLADFLEYTNVDTNIDDAVIELFKAYDWTVDYKINNEKVLLPQNLTHKAGEYPIKLYWAYNNELSKNIGMDFTDYLSEEVEVEIYKLREPLPDFMEPREDARGIIIKYKKGIVGAYIDAGRHNSFACSLDRKSIEEITGNNWNQWIEGFIDYEDELEIELSKMSPEEVIQTYFEALNNEDYKRTLACLARGNLCGYLSTNMDNECLYNDYKDIDFNINSVKLLSIEQMDNIDNAEGILEYVVQVDFDFKKFITSDDGVSIRFVIMEKETEKSGWRIIGVGTGP